MHAEAVEFQWCVSALSDCASRLQCSGAFPPKVCAIFNSVHRSPQAAQFYCSLRKTRSGHPPIEGRCHTLCRGTRLHVTPWPAPALVKHCVQAKSPKDPGNVPLPGLVKALELMWQHVLASVLDVCITSFVRCRHTVALVLDHDMAWLAPCLWKNATSSRLVQSRAVDLAAIKHFIMFCLIGYWPGGPLQRKAALAFVVLFGLRW